MLDGILEIIKELKVNNIVISKQYEKSENYEEFKNIVKDKSIKLIVTKKGDKIQIERDIYFSFLWPGSQNIINENILNNNSIVCKLNYKNFSMLFTGDIEELAEDEILKEYGSNNESLKATALKVAHHGSSSSSTKKFLEAVNPKFVLIGVGKNNKFGHPNNDVIYRLENIKSKIYRTDEMGEVDIEVNNKGRIKIDRYIK